MKKGILITLCFFSLLGCATTDPEKLERAKQYEERSQSASQRAQKLGDLKGTPDNIEYTERAYEESSYYGKKAHDAKYKDTWFSFLVSLLFGFADE